MPWASSTRSIARNSSAMSASRANRREGAVHAEDAVGCDQGPPEPAPIALQERGQPSVIAMRIDLNLGAAEPCAVDQARVVERVGIDRVARIDQGGDRAKVRGESRRKQGDSFGLLEFRQAVGKRLVSLGPTGEKRRRPCPPAISRGGGLCRGDHARVDGETEIVV